MKRETLVWTILIAVFGLVVVINAITRHAGQQFITETERTFVDISADDEDPSWVEVDGTVNGGEALDYDLSTIPDDRRVTWTEMSRAKPNDFAEAVEKNPNQVKVRFSLIQTIGVWVAAIFTLSILSFLYKDNPFYKTAESCVVGISAAYWMVVGFWSTLVPNLLGNLLPDLVRNWVSPGAELSFDWVYIFPLILSIMLLWRLSPKGGWIARWPMAFIIGVFCGFRLISFLHADFLVQIRPGINSLAVMDEATGDFMFWDSVKALMLFIGVLSSLTYFFFSIEHKGVVGHTARVGMGFLMITFGAAFGFTVMGRIALLSIRLEFLFDDWLWLIDPRRSRILYEAGEAATSTLMTLMQSGLS